MMIGGSAFYPEHVARKDWLSWYAKQFLSTEINGSFYRTPSIEAVQAWRDRTPAKFRFAWKASKFITHWKRLSVRSENSIELLVSRLAILGTKCGPVLFQLPPQFRADRERLANFLKCFRPAIATPSSSDMRAGTRNQFLHSYANKTSRFACPTIMMRPRRG